MEPTTRTSVHETLSPAPPSSCGRESLVTERTADAYREGALFPTLVEHAPDGIMVAFGPPDFPIIVVNRMAEQLLGIPREQLLGSSATEHSAACEFLLSDRATRPAPHEMPLIRAATRGESIRDEEWVIARPDGTRTRVAVNTNPIRSGDGRVVGAINCWRDITDLKRVEAALRENEAKLREADRRKNAFVAMLAHELRNPLAPIRNAVEILRLKAAADAGLKSVAEIIDRQVTNIARLLDDVLDLSRVSLGKLGLQNEAIDLSTVVERALEWTRPQIDARRHRLSVDTPTEPVRVRGDLVRLTQVLSNLLGNAAKYTDPGGQIGVVLEKDAAEAVLRVRDSGRGLEPADLKNLFDLFYQLERNFDRAEGGLGIGLSLVRSLVQMHGGRVEVTSAGRGMGSEFTVRLPLLFNIPGKACTES